VRIMGNSRIDPCSKLLKRELIWRWMRTNCVEMTSTMYLGLDWTEGHRLKQLQERKAQWRIDAPMQWEPLWDKNKMFCELGKLGIKVPRLYRLGFAHNNCGGFCVKAGQAAFVNLLRKLPERYAFHEAQEELFREKFGGHSILKKVINGETHSLTLRQLRESVEAGGEYDRHDWGGCGCSVEPINLQTPEVEKVKP